MTLTAEQPSITWRLLASAASAGLARDLVGNALKRWGMPVVEADAVLIIGELMANAVAVSSTAETVKVHARCEDGHVVLAVWDGGKGHPMTRHVELDLDTLDLSEENHDANGGWGLRLVVALAVRCWVEATPPRGKWVCAMIATEVAR
ncbi:ATP-binding protein [Actinomadura formosensis]|uniref:ATP-binding protein n=1 Tax=Actinomadura formosensis TaxID=60706 RepID=UPI000B0DC637|nr:ATP-binding protein [Actinomadura formosensis]